jgi:hypothetical protein
MASLFCPLDYKVKSVHVHDYAYTYRAFQEEENALYSVYTKGGTTYRWRRKGAAGFAFSPERKILLHGLGFACLHQDSSCLV